MSQKLIDQWTPLHLLSGIVMQRRGFSPATAVLLTLGFEVLENEVLSKTMAKREKHTNVASDLIFNMAGYFSAKKIYEKKD